MPQGVLAGTPSKALRTERPAGLGGVIEQVSGKLCEMEVENVGQGCEVLATRRGRGQGCAAEWCVIREPALARQRNSE